MNGTSPVDNYLWITLKKIAKLCSLSVKRENKRGYKKGVHPSKPNLLKYMVQGFEVVGV